MKKEELSKAYKLHQRWMENEEVLVSLRSKSNISLSKLDALPHTTGGVSDKTYQIASTITDLEAEQKRLQRQIQQELKKIMAFLDTVDRQNVRIAMRFRFVSFMLWKEVAYMMGPLYDETSVRKMVSNYLTKHT